MLERYIFHHTMTASQEKKNQTLAYEHLDFRKSFRVKLVRRKKNLPEILLSSFGRNLGL